MQTTSLSLLMELGCSKIYQKLMQKSGLSLSPDKDLLITQLSDTRSEFFGRSKMVLFDRKWGWCKRRNNYHISYRKRNSGYFVGGYGSILICHSFKVFMEEARLRCQTHLDATDENPAHVKIICASIFCAPKDCMPNVFVFHRHYNVHIDFYVELCHLRSLSRWMGRR